jgi:DNA gyrase subunit A
VLRVTSDDEIIIIASSGKLIRLRASNIRIIGRATKGVKLIDLAGDDKVVSIARVAEKDADDTGKSGDLFKE